MRILAIFSISFLLFSALAQEATTDNSTVVETIVNDETVTPVVANTEETLDILNTTDCAGLLEDADDEQDILEEEDTEEDEDLAESSSEDHTNETHHEAANSTEVQSNTGRQNRLPPKDARLSTSYRSRSRSSYRYSSSSYSYYSYSYSYSYGYSSSYSSSSNACWNVTNCTTCCINGACGTVDECAAVESTMVWIFIGIFAVVAISVGLSIYRRFKHGCHNGNHHHDHHEPLVSDCHDQPHVVGYVPAGPNTVVDQAQYQQMLQNQQQYPQGSGYPPQQYQYPPLGEGQQNPIGGVQYIQQPGQQYPPGAYVYPPSQQQFH